MKNLDIIIPVKNEETNIYPLIQRINKSMLDAKIPYKMIFVDDHSTDKTLEVLNLLQESYPIEIYTKKGKPGKAYSILEGAEYSKSDNIAMIDADLQYPPEVIPQMLEQLEDSGVVIAKRKTDHRSKLRKFITWGFTTVFSKLLHNLDLDVQSGLKIFKREVIEKIDVKKITPWTLDLSLVLTARDLGLGVSEVDIEFDKRVRGNSKVSIVRTSFEIGKNALKLKFFRERQFLIKPESNSSMQGSGIALKGNRYITHTTLGEGSLALKTFNFWQKTFLWTAFLGIIAGLLINPLTTVLAVVGFLSVIYFADVVFNIAVMLKSLHFPPEIKIAQEDIAELVDKELPVYTILCPLYRESRVLPHFLDSIEKLNWPKNKLDVILLLEEDDKETVDEISKQKLPGYVRVIVTPDSQPKTKPKACNYGLANAKGEYLVIYDAEDIPEPDQLKKAYLAFKKSKPNIVCLQAKLNYFNPHQNLLTRFFTAEYSLWFDVVLPGLQSIDTVIPLGGTSNHFKTKTLKELQGWDPFNVTEDCDLGIRIFKQGYKTAIIDSLTLEEANSNLGNWVRQRSRWLKGYMQTYLVHMRNPFELIKNHGWHAFVFQLIIGARISFMLINPILWATTFAYFAFYAYVGPAIEEVFPTFIFYLAVTSLIVGNFSYIYNYMIGAVKRENYSLVKYVFLIPFYWLVASWAAVIAAYQLIVKPHYWEKTIHGLHLEKLPQKVEEIKEKVIEEIKEEIVPEVTKEFIGDPWYKKIRVTLSVPQTFVSSVIFIASSLTAGLLNLGFNVYLGRTVSFQELGLVTLVNGFMYFSTIPQAALAGTVTHQVGFFEGRKNLRAITGFLNKTTKKFLLISYILTGIWLFLIPELGKFFKTENLLPLIVFAPVWTFGIAAAISRGFLSGKLLFGRMSVLMISEPLIKFAAAFALISAGLSAFVYSVLPISVVAAFFIAIFLSSKFLKIQSSNFAEKENRFPGKFFSISALAVLAPMAFLSLDVLLAQHYLPAEEAGKYALVSLVGKIIYFLGILAPQLILPIVSRNEGANKKSENILMYVFIATFLLAGTGYLFWGMFGWLTAPIVFGAKALSVIQYLEPFTFAMLCFSLSQVFVTYYLAKKIYTLPVVSFLLTGFQIALIYISHQSVDAIVWDMFFVSLLNLVVLASLHLSAPAIKVFESNLADFLGLVSSSKEFARKPGKKLRVLILNWRDTKHVWAGGAEAYLHELSKVWVSEGIQVTMFCGNDGKHLRNEVIDGVQIVRRGGFYTVYIWAFLYYILRFRGRFDIVIDSANGIPFFTPFYAGVPKFLLIYHIHQEVFREHLPFGISHFARFLEKRVMPFIYKNKKIITISDSTRDEILKLKFDGNNLVDIVHPGAAVGEFKKMKKTEFPSVLYLGRLQPYKNVDVALNAFSQVVTKFPDARFVIAGFGEALNGLKSLAEKLNIQNNVDFLGRVDEGHKRELMAKSWVMVQPSMVEGWGITVIEANAAGTTVIASNVNGLRDSVIDGKTGFLVKPKDVKMLAGVMIDLINNHEFRGYLSEQAHTWAQNFSWEQSAKKFLSIIQEEMDKNKKVEFFVRGALAKE